MLDLTLFFNFPSKLKGTRSNDRVADATGPPLEAKATDTASLRDIIGIGEFDAGRARLDLDWRYRWSIEDLHQRLEGHIRMSGSEPTRRSAAPPGTALTGRFDSFNRHRPNGWHPARRGHQTCCKFHSPYSELSAQTNALGQGLSGKFL